MPRRFHIENWFHHRPMILSIPQLVVSIIKLFSSFFFSQSTPISFIVKSFNTLSDFSRKISILVQNCPRVAVKLYTIRYSRKDSMKKTNNRDRFPIIFNLCTQTHPPSLKFVFLCLLGRFSTKRPLCFCVALSLQPAQLYFLVAGQRTTYQVCIESKTLPVNCVIPSSDKNLYT